MNIMYLLFSFTMGGTERLVTDICNEMSAQGNNVFLYIVNDLYSESLLQLLDEKVHVELQRRPVGGGKLIRTMGRVACFIKKFRIEVVHCNSFDAPELLLFHPVLFPKTRIVHTIHGMGQYNKIRKLRALYRNVICDKFIAISDSVKEDIEGHGASPRKTVTLYNAINLDRFCARKIEEQNTEHVVVGNVARIFPKEKGQDVLIEAIARLKELYPTIRCFFAGEAPSRQPEIMEELKDQVKRLGVEDNIVFLGNVEDVPSFLCTLNLFVLPSRFEGFGIALIEAMAMGIPCIASNLDGPAEIIGDDIYGMLFTCGDAQMLAEKIDFAIQNYTACKEKALKTMEYVRQTFDMKKMCKKLIDVYCNS